MNSQHSSKREITYTPLQHDDAEDIESITETTVWKATGVTSAKRVILFYLVGSLLAFGISSLTFKMFATYYLPEDHSSAVSLLPECKQSPSHTSFQLIANYTHLQSLTCPRPSTSIQYMAATTNQLKAIKHGPNFQMNTTAYFL
jgi:hypothetical protein